MSIIYSPTPLLQKLSRSQSFFKGKLSPLIPDYYEKLRYYTATIYVDSKMEMVKWCLKFEPTNLVGMDKAENSVHYMTVGQLFTKICSTQLKM